MDDHKIMCTTTNQEYDYDKNEYVTTNSISKIISDTCYHNMTSKGVIEFFKSLGAREQVTRKCGRVTKLVSTSPSGKLRTIRTFEFFE